MTTYTVYWQPGCTSCLKTKEFLRSHGIAFESVNVREAPGAMERLARLGAKSIPVVTRGDEFAFGQNLDDVARFVGVAVTRTMLATPVLVARLIALLDIAACYAEQLPEGARQTKLPGRERTYLDLAYHVSQIVVGFLDSALGGRLTFEHFERRPPEHVLTGADSARITRSVSQALAVWWSVNQPRLPATLDTYYGVQPLQAVLERTTWHVAQHVRQLDRVLELLAIAQRVRLPAHLLEDLPLPRDVWDAEVPLQ
jgi:arsenate reductase-like glutaredoxin family protein